MLPADAEGKKQLTVETSKWDRLAGAIARIPAFTNGAHVMIPRRPDLDDLDREIRDHLEAEMHDNVAQGMSEDEARAAAIRKFGNIARVKEDVRAVWLSRLARSAAPGCA